MATSWFTNRFSKRSASPEGHPTVGRALELFRQGRFEEAILVADVLLEAHPDVAMTWRFRGECLFALERFADAAASFGHAYVLGGPGTEEVFIWESLSLFNAGHADEAKRVIHRLLSAGSLSAELSEKAHDVLQTIENDAARKLA